MITRNHRQESLSRAYVQAVAARAGAICVVPELDYGIDLSLREVDEANGFVDAGVVVDLQLKSTTAAAGDADSIGFDLRVSDYNRLRRTDGPVPRVLVVLVRPAAEADWLTQTVDELILRHAAYWVSLRGHPPTSAAASVRVRLPRANLFTPAAVTDLLARARTGGFP